MKTLFNNCEAPLARHRPQHAGLYRAVILRAVQNLKYKRYGGEAREWLLSSESDAAFASAGINPDLIRVHIM
jgi:hypothetical protein